MKYKAARRTTHRFNCTELLQSLLCCVVLCSAVLYTMLWIAILHYVILHDTTVVIDQRYVASTGCVPRAPKESDSYILYFMIYTFHLYL